MPANSRSAERKELACLYLRRGALVVIPLLLVVAGIYYYLGARPYNGITVGVMYAELDRYLPLGSSDRDAVQWFRSRAISVGNDVERLKESDLKASLNNNSHFHLADLEIILSFDERGKLTNRHVRRVIHAHQYRIPYDWTYSNLKPSTTRANSPN